MSETLTIAIVGYPSLGGSGVVAAELAAGLADRGHRVHVIASAPPSRPLARREGLFFHEVQVSDYPLFDHMPYELAVASTILAVASAHPLDIVHAHYAVPHAASAYLARQALGRTPPRIVTTLHGTDVTRVGSDPRYHAITRFTVAASDGVTVPSVFLKQEAERLLRLPARVPIEVIPNFVDTERFTPAARRDRQRFAQLFAASPNPAEHEAAILFHVSNFRPVKRVPDLIEALAGVRRVRPARLVLVGDGPERPHAVARARELGVESSVCFLGALPDFIDYLRHADAFVLASDSESFGVAALEALSAGVPVVAYRVGGLPEVVPPDTGRLVNPYDVTALTNAILDVVADAERRAAFGAAARAHAVAHFGRAPAMQRYEECYRRALAKSDAVIP